jgi:hypothetical protein
MTALACLVHVSPNTWVLDVLSSVVRLSCV